MQLCGCHENQGIASSPIMMVQRPYAAPSTGHVVILAAYRHSSCLVLFQALEAAQKSGGSAQLQKLQEAGSVASRFFSSKYITQLKEQTARIGCKFPREKFT